MEEYPKWKNILIYACFYVTNKRKRAFILFFFFYKYKLKSERTLLGFSKWLVSASHSDRAGEVCQGCESVG